MLQAVAQNVGIGNIAPLAKLDVNGDVAYRSADITIASTYTYALDVNTVKQSHYKLKSPILPIGNFVLAGITAGTDGRIVTLTNYSGASMEIYNEDATANANDRIKTGIATTLAVYPNGSVLLQYDVPEQRWLVKGGHNNSLSYFGGGGGGGSSYWDLNGANIFNNNTGNVGIGVTSPGFKLDIAGEQRIHGSPITTPGFNGGLTSGGTLRISNTANSYFLKIDGVRIQAEKPNTQSTGTTASTLSINPHGGNVGIGIDGDIPYKLSIYQPVIDGATTNTFVAQLRGQNPMLHFVDQFNTSRGYIKGITNRTATPHFAREGIEIGTGGGDIYLTAAGYLPALMVKGTNNYVGIGTNDPNSPLSFPNTLGKKISFWNSGNNDYGIGIQSGTLQIYTAGQDQIAFGWGSSSNFLKTMTYYPGTAQLGINCLPQSGYNLAVDGKIKAKEIVVELAGWADYVFEEDYKLASLESVEQHIKANRHLPGIPSADNIQKQGLSVGAVQTKMMAKIEELTLYLIEANKRIGWLEQVLMFSKK